MKKYLLQNKKFVVLSGLFVVSIFLIAYTFFFQYPALISKYALLKSSLLGIGTGFLLTLVLRRIERIIQVQEIKKWGISSFFMGLLGCSLILSFIDIPNNSLFAPHTSIVVEIPPESEGGSPATLQYIHNGLSFININDISLSEGSTISNGTVLLTPLEKSPASFSWQGRTWERVEFSFSHYLPGSQITFHYAGQSDIFYFEENNQETSITTSIEIPGFWLYDFLSRVSTLSSIFIVLYSISFSLLCFSGNFTVNIVKWVGVVFFILWLLNYARVLLFNPNPAEYREGANLLMTEYLLQGKNPFSVENQPLLNTNKGFLYNFVVLPFAALFGNTLFIHRLISMVFIFFSCVLIFLVLRKSSVPLPFALAGGSIMGACSLFYVSPIARVDGLGTFLFLAATFLPWLGNFEKKSLYISGFLGILAFYTKPYFLLSVAIVAAYLFLFVSKKKGFWYGFLTLLSLFLTCILVRKIFECYFLHTVFNSFSNASNSNSVDWMLYQIFRFVKIFLPIGVMYLILITSRASAKEKGGNKEPISFWRSFIFSHPEKPFTEKKLNYFVFSFWISTIVIIVLLGENHGNNMVYLFQLMAPPLIIFTFQQLASHYQTASITVPLVLINLTVLCFGVLYPNNPEPYSSAWDTLNSYVESSERVLNSPLLVSKMIQENLLPVDSGSSEYYFSTKQYPTNYFVPDYQLIEQQGVNYRNEIEKQVENQYYDRIMITEDYSPFCRIEIIEENYELIDRVNLYLPQSDQNWVVQVWIPKM